MKAKLPCYKEPSTGVVHLKNWSGYGGGEYTLCGDAFDRPLNEDDEEAMIDSSDVCNCRRCIEAAQQLYPYLQKQLKRINKKEVKK